MSNKKSPGQEEQNKKTIDNSTAQKNFVASRMRKIDSNTDPKQSQIVEFILKPEIETFKTMKALYPHQSTISMDQPFGYYAFNKLHPERFYKAKKFYTTKKFKECSKIMSELVSKLGLYRTVYALVRENELNMLKFVFRNRHTPTDEVESILSTSYDELRMKQVPISNSMCEYIEKSLLSIRLVYGVHRCQFPYVSYVDNSLERTQYFIQVLSNVSEFLIKLNECRGPAYHKTLDDRAFLYSNLKFILENIRIVKYFLRRIDSIVPWDNLEFFVYIYVLYVKNSPKFDKFYLVLLNDKIFYKFLDKFITMLNDFNMRATIRDNDGRRFYTETVNLEFINFGTTVENLKNLFYLNRIIGSVHVLESTNNLLVIERVANIIQNLFNFNSKRKYFTKEIFEALTFLRSESYDNDPKQLIKFAKNCESILNYERYWNLMNFIKMYERRNFKYLSFLLKHFTNAEIQNLFDSISDRTATMKMGQVIGNKEHHKFKYWNVFVLGNVDDNTDNFNYILNSLKQFETDLNFSNGIHMETVRNIMHYKEITDSEFLNNLAVKMYKYGVLDILPKFRIQSHKPLNVEELFYLEYVNKFKEYLSETEFNHFCVNFKAIKQSFIEKRQSISDTDGNDVAKAVETTKYESFIVSLTNHYAETKFDHLKKHDLVKDFISDLKLNIELKTRLHEVIDIIYNNDQNNLYLVMDSLKVDFTNTMASFETCSPSDTEKLFALEMLAIKLFKILVDAVVFMPDVFLADSNSPLLCGITLYTFLTEGDLLHDILSENPYYTIKCNLSHYLIDQDWPILLKSTLKLAPEIMTNDLIRRHEKTIKWLAVQNQMYLSVKTGDLDSFREHIEKEADIRGISFENKSIRHYLSRYDKYDLYLETTVSKLHNSILLKHNNLVLANIKKENLGVRDPLTGKSLLHFAVDVGSVEMIKLLLHEGVYIDITDKMNMTPLLHAILNNDLKIVKLLIEKNSNPLKLHKIQVGLNIFETNAFLLSLMHSNKNIVKFLFDMFQNSIDKTIIRKLNLVYLTCLHTTGVDHLKSFLYNQDVKFDVNELYEFNNRFLTILHGAIYFNNESMVKFLLNLKTCDYNIKTNYLENALHLACQRNNDNLQIIKQLLNKNLGYLTEKDVNGDTPLDLAILHNNYNTVLQILKYNNNEITNDNLVNAIKSNSYLILSELLMINDGRMIEHPNLISIIKSENILKLLYENPEYTKLFETDNNDERNNILHYTMFNNNLDILKYFDEINFINETNLNATNLYSLLTPVHIAVDQNQLATVTFLLSRYSNLINFDIPNYAGFSLLHIAVSNNYTEMFKILINTGRCNLNLLNKHTDMSPLHSAIDNKNYELIELLLNAGCDFNLSSKTRPNFTPLLHAITKHDEYIVNILLTYGVDVKMHNPLHLAIENDSLVICRLLIEHGADVNSTNFTLNMTPLHLAAYTKQNDILKLLLKSNALPNYQISYNDVFTDNDYNFLEKFIKLDVGNFTDIVNERFNMKTPLHFAIENNNLDAVKMLVSHGASVNRCCSLNRNPLGLAKMSTHSNSEEIQKYLIKNGAIDRSDAVNIHLANILGNCNLSSKDSL